MPWRSARRPTTNRPIRRDTDTSTTGGSARRRLASASSSSVMPMPESRDREHARRRPRCRLLETVTWVSCGEKEMAFSTSSATRWTMSLTAWPTTEIAGAPGRSPARSPRPPTARRGRRRSSWTGWLRLRRRLLAGEDQEVLGVAAHAGGQVVELEQVGQPAAVLLALLQTVDQRDLPLDQRLGAPREVDEHRVDVAAQLGLLARQPDGLRGGPRRRPGRPPRSRRRESTPIGGTSRCRRSRRRPAARGRPPAAGIRRPPGPRSAAGAAAGPASGR